MERCVEGLKRSLEEDFKNRFQAQKTVMSYFEYLEEVAQKPTVHIRNAAQYFADMVDYFGTYQVDLPVGKLNRFKLFDLEFDHGEGQVMGQERVQEDIISHIRNFVRSGRMDRLVMLHGPNGSAKTSLVQALTRAAEVYSEKEQGVLYRFNWVFPVKKVVRGSLGFSSEKGGEQESYAYLKNEEIEARIPCEHKDHPLLLLPLKHRDTLIRQLIETKMLPVDFPIADVFRKGDLTPKNKKIFEALLTSCHGDVQEVLRHIQVERFYLSRRYRTGIVSVEPQMSVDAFVRQVTADQSLASLPTSLQYVALYETGGALTAANRGVLEYNDLLKRPLESWKYLLVATEQSQASLDVLSIFLDLLMIATANELHLAGFREYPDWQSFKGRIELVKVPYLLRFSDELKIYENQIPRALVGTHIAPHALEIVARWSVLTRLEAPRLDNYPESQQDLIRSITPLEKLELYDTGTLPERLSQKDGRELKQLISKLYSEFINENDYEGRYGASPREMRTLLMNASQNPKYDHLSPLAILEELRELVKEKSSYEFLRREPMRGYRDAERFIDIVEYHYLKQLEEEIRTAIGLIQADSHRLLFEKYIKNVSAWTKKEKMADPVTGKMVDADHDLMAQVERVLLAKGEMADDFRKSVIGQIGAYRLEHPDHPVDYTLLFLSYLRKLKDDYYEQQRKVIEQIQSCYLAVLSGDTAGFDEKEIKQVHILRSNLEALGYTESSARHALAFLVRSRP